MTVEQIIEAYWKIQGYWTITRFPFKVAKKRKNRKNNSGWSDIDILAYNPIKKELVICESKVRKKKNALLGVSNGNVGDYLGDFKTNTINFLNGDEIQKLVDFKSVDKVTIQFVGNVFWDDKKDNKQNVTKKMENGIKNKVKNRLKSKIEFQIHSTFDILCKIIEIERNNEQGKRYGHPVLDIVREMNRYMINRNKGKEYIKEFLCAMGYQSFEMRNGDRTQ